MPKTEIKKGKPRLRTKVADYLRQHRRATRMELLFLVLVFLIFEFVIPTLLSSDYSKQFFEKHLSDAFQYQVTFERINTNVFGRPMVRVSGFIVHDHQGQPFFRADDVKMELNLWSLLRGRVVLTRIYVADGNFLAARLPDGRWNVADLVKAGYDPDQAIDLQTAAVEMKNVVVTFHDQSLSVPFTQHIRLRDGFISSLDVRRRTRLRVDAIDDDRPESNLEVNGNFAVFVPDDISTLSGHLSASLNHFNLQILNPYLRSLTYPVVGWEGFYDLQIEMNGRGASPLPISIRSKIGNLKIAVVASRPEAVKPAADTASSPEWIHLGSAALEGILNVTSDEIRFGKLRGDLASHRFEWSGRLLNLQTSTPRIESNLTTEDFNLVEPIRSLIRVEMDEFTRRVFSGMTGTARANLKWSGRINQPVFDWSLELKKVQYRDLKYHFELKDIAAVIRSNARKTQIDSLRAQFFSTSLQASGSVDENGQVDVNLSLAALPLDSFYPYLKQLHDRGDWNMAPGLDRMLSASGLAQAKLHVAGSRDHPKISGAVSLARGEVRLVGLSMPVEELKGQLVLEDDVVRVRQMTGSLGDSPFEIEALLARDNFSLLALRLASPQVNLRRYDELVASGWIKPIEFPHIGQLKEAEGIIALEMKFGSIDSKDSAGAKGRGDAVPEFSVQAQNASAKLSKVDLPLKNFSGGLAYSMNRLKFDHLSGALGDSRFSMDGTVDHYHQPEERWNLKAEGNFLFPQLASLFPSSWKNEFSANGRVPVQMSFQGARSEGVQVEAGMDWPAATEYTVEDSFQKPAGVPSQGTFSGVWKDRTFTLGDGKLTLDEVPFGVQGTLDFTDANDPQINLSFLLTQFASVNSLMKFVKLPAGEPRIRGGSASGTLTLSGSLNRLFWNSSLRVADLSIVGMPWGTTNLTGDLTAGREGVSAKDFLAIINNVPMRVTGKLDLGESDPNLTVEVSNMNLDALVATILRMSGASETATFSTSRKPLSITVSASSGVFFHRPIKKFLTQGQWEESVLRLEPLEVTAGESSSRAHIAWNSRTNEQHMEFESRAVPMGAFLDEVLDLQLPVDGKLNVIADLTSRNPDPKNRLASFEGKAHFEVSDGTLQNAGLPQRLLSMAVLAHEGLFGFNLGRIFQTIDPPKFKTFDRWSADVAFRPDGTALLERSEFKSDLFDLDASGTINTKTEEILISVKGSLPEIPRGSNFLVHIFGRISIRELYRNTRDFMLLISGQRKRIKPRRHHFEFRLTGNLEGVKSIEDFRFVP